MSEELGTRICPACNGTVARVDLSASGAGDVHFSSCCGVGLALLDNWDVIEALPEVLQQKAIEDSRAELEQWQERNAAEREAGAAQRERARQILRDLAKEVRSYAN